MYVPIRRLSYNQHALEVEREDGEEFGFVVCQAGADLVFAMQDRIKGLELAVESMRETISMARAELAERVDTDAEREGRGE